MPGPDKQQPIQPLTPEERASWNNFLRFVNSKGYTGNKALDERDESLGSSLMDAFNKEAGRQIITPDMVPKVQREFQYFKDNGVFPGNGDYGNFKRILASQVKQENLSPVDGWFGSLTSQQAYPELKDTNGHNWGTDYNSFIESMKNKLSNKYASK